MQPQEVVAFIAFMLCAAFVVKTAIDSVRRSAAQKRQMEMFNKLLDKSQGSKDMLDYLQTEAGQKLLEAAPLVERERVAPHGRIFNALQAGIVALALGIGGLILHAVVDNADAREAMLVFGTIGIALGLGLMVAGGASLWLSRSLGLMNGRHDSR